jgi:hypothetical protein
MYSMSGQVHVELIGTKKSAVLTHLTGKFYARTCLLNPEGVASVGAFPRGGFLVAPGEA